MQASIADSMFSIDRFSQWLGIEIIEQSPGYCRLQMTVRPEMCNGFDIAHGGITYSLADSALAFASNSRGKKAVSIETSISHTAMLHAGDTIIATVTEKSLSNSIGIYEVVITRKTNEVVALFKGTVYRKGEWPQQD